jgi:hypothetical protein
MRAKEQDSERNRRYYLKSKQPGYVKNDPANPLTALRKWRKENPELWRAQKQRGHDRAKVLVFDHYGRVCTCCGDTHEEFMTLHHTKNNGAEHRREIKRMGTSFYRWVIQNNYPSDLETHCWNCNCSKGKHGYCPHEREREASKSVEVLQVEDAVTVN